MSSKPPILMLTLMLVITPQAIPAEETATPTDGPKKAVQVFLAADANGDGMLSQEEVQQAVQKCFDKTDTNKDGQLDQVELNQAAVNLEQKLKRGVGALAKVKRGTMLKRWERFTAADTNHDGTLSKLEAPGRLKQHFDKIDTNNDGQIEKAELKKAIETWGRK